MSSFAAVQLTPEPVIDISGASGVTLMLALAHGQDWSGHVPGPCGLPGGYADRVEGRPYRSRPSRRHRSRGRRLRWNVRFEADNGLVVGPDGRARYTGRLHDALKAESPDIAAGFDVADLEQVWQEMSALRERMLARPA